MARASRLAVLHHQCRRTKVEIDVGVEVADAIWQTARTITPQPPTLARTRQSDARVEAARGEVALDMGRNCTSDPTIETQMQGTRAAT